MDQESSNEDGIIYCSFREIGIILPNKRFYKCIKPDVCCDTGCCNEQSYKFGTVWQYWQVVLIIGLIFVIVSIIRYCCWLCKRKHTATTAANTLRINNRPASVSVTIPSSQTMDSTGHPRPYPSNSTTLCSAPAIVRPIIGGRRSSAHTLRNSASVFGLGGTGARPPPSLVQQRLLRSAGDDMTCDTNDRLADALVARDSYGLNSLAYPWGGRVVVPRQGDAATRALVEDDRLELGIRAIGGNTELRDQSQMDRTIGRSNPTTDNGDLALLTHLMALDIIYHSDNNNNSDNDPATIEKPPDYEQCLLDLAGNVKLTEIGDDLQPPTYDTICHAEYQTTAPTAITDIHQYQTGTVNDHVSDTVGTTRTVTTPEIDTNCHTST